MNEVVLYLIRGVPGSGKSTLANQLKICGLVHNVHEADDYFIDNDGNYNFDAKKLGQAHSQCQYQVEIDLRNNLSVAVSNTSTTEKEVAVYQKIAQQAGAKFISLIVENRHGGTNCHNVPEDKIQQMADRFSVKLQ